MTESSQSTPPATADDPAYRPISVCAVVGLVLAGSFALWLSIAAVIAFRAGQPLLLHPVALLLPLVAGLLSMVGWRQVLHSEGTRVGLRLAQWGLTLSLLFGLGYAAYSAFGYVAVRRQAQEFTLQWMEQVRRSSDSDADRCAAFWNTIDPLRRDRTVDLNNAEARKKLGDNAAALAAFQESLRQRYYWSDRGVKGPYPRFFDHEVVLLLQEGGEQTTVEPLGVRNWEYVSGTEGGYLMEQAYRLKTREGVFELSLQVMGKDIDRWHWQVILPESVVRQARISAFGQWVRSLRAESRRFATDWFSSLAEGKVEDAFLHTLLPLQRAELRDRGAKAIRATPPYAMFLDSGVRCGPLATDRKQIVPEVEKATQQLLRNAADGKGFPLHVPAINDYPLGDWRLTADELAFVHPFSGILAGKYRCDGHVTVATSDPTTLAKLRAAEQAGSQPAEPLQLGRPTSWRISDVVIENASTVRQNDEPK